MPTRKTLIGDVDLEDLVDRISFSQEEIQQAVLEQAKLFLAAADYRVKKMRTRQEKEAGLEILQANLSLSLRRKHTAEGGKKSMTEGHLRDLLDTQASVQDAKRDLASARQLEEWSKLLLDGYWQRKDVLKLVAQLAYSEDTFRIAQGDVSKLRTRRADLRRLSGEKEMEDL